MEIIDKEMEKTGKPHEDPADGINAEAQLNSMEGLRGIISKNKGTFVLFNLIVAGIAVLTLWFGYQSYQISRNGETTMGTVTELTESSAGDDCCAYSPVVEYSVDGQSYFFEGKNASNPPKYHVGQQVDVIFNRTSPSEGAINSWSEIWLAPVLLGLATPIVAIVLDGYAFYKISKGEPILKFDE